MNPHEVLAELDRLQMTIWYPQLGPDQDPGTTIRFGTGNKRLYPELQRAVKEKTPELLKLARLEPSKSTPGIYVRKPNPSQAGDPTGPSSVGCHGVPHRRPRGFPTWGTKSYCMGYLAGPSFLTVASPDAEKPVKGV